MKLIQYLMIDMMHILCISIAIKVSNSKGVYSFHMNISDDPLTSGGY